VKLIDISSHRQSTDFEESNPDRPDEDNNLGEILLNKTFLKLAHNYLRLKI